MNDDSKFVRALFGFIAWLMMTVPFIYSLIRHNWWLLLGLVLGAFGAVLKTAVAQHEG